MVERPERPVTIYDVAQAAGVAPSTVSRTFARPGRVNADTAARVRRVATELGYRSRPIPRAQPSSDTRLLAVMVADITNPYYSQLVRGAQLAAADAGYEILLADARESGSRERRALERLLPVVEGIVIGSSRLPDAALRTIAKQKAVVALNRGLPDVSSVMADNPGGVQAAIDLLAGLGHRSVTYLAGPEASWTDGVRSRAVHDLGVRAGLHTQRLGPFQPTLEGGAAAARQLLGRLPSAVIAYNDLIAIGAVRALAVAGVQVPGEVSVVGFDDIPMSALVSPALTTVAVPMRQLGDTAVRNLAALINGARTGGSALVLPVKLMVRDSTGPGPGAGADRVVATGGNALPPAVPGHHDGSALDRMVE